MNVTPAVFKESERTHLKALSKNFRKYIKNVSSYFKIDLIKRIKHLFPLTRASGLGICSFLKTISRTFSWLHPSFIPVPIYQFCFGKSLPHCPLPDTLPLLTYWLFSPKWPLSLNHFPKFLWYLLGYWFFLSLCLIRAWYTVGIQ